MERERTLKLLASDEEWSRFNESIPREWRARFEQLAACVEVDVDEKPDSQRRVALRRHVLRDRRANKSKYYETAHRRGRFLSSWKIGMRQRSDGSKSVSFTDGITWGSIGQILGYLFGDLPTSKRRELHAMILDAFPKTDHGAPMRGEDPDSP